MRKVLASLAFIIISLSSNAQLEVAKLIGKKSSTYGLGYGAFFKIGVPVSDNAEVTTELGAIFMFSKAGGGDGIGVIPITLGYRYTFNDSHSGFYAEPELGYSFYKAISDEGDGPFNGPVWAVGGGYIFDFGGSTGLNAGLRYESVIGSGGTIGYVAFRIAATMTLGNRE